MEVFEGEKGLVTDMPGRVRWSIYSKRLGRGSIGTVRMPIGVLDGGAYCRNLANTIEPSVCGGDAALCQISLILVSLSCYSFRALLPTSAHRHSRSFFGMMYVSSPVSFAAPTS